MNPSRRMNAPVLLACFLPLVWICYQLSNRDPFLLGACIVVTMLTGPISAFLLCSRLRKAKSKNALLWSLVVVNAAVPLTVIVLLGYGWYRVQAGLGPW